jgi:hypothetical protein
MGRMDWKREKGGREGMGSKKKTRVQGSGRRENVHNGIEKGEEVGRTYRRMKRRRRREKRGKKLGEKEARRETRRRVWMARREK